jgi:hypothetical protein
MPDSPTYSSKAWLLDGPIHSCPGILHLVGDTLTYLILEPGTFSDKGIRKQLAKHGQADEGELDYPVELFSIPRSAIDRFHIPWYYFGGGGKLAFGEHHVRLSFLRPQNTLDPTYYSEALMRYVGGEGQEKVKISEGRKVGKRWRELLG